ncbi:MAG TPA: tol-pal system protein YbgF [Candidatus Aquilonibacter sp.]|nr:tol-pal system protein YbgF [Candidatus Aquilonibacter sp.]
MRIRWVTLALIAMIFGAVGGAILAPQPAGAVSRDMVELEQNVSQLLQGQQDLRSAMDANNASMKTLVQQSIDTVNQMSSQMGALQKTMQDAQANTGSKVDGVAQQTQGISDNVQDLQARVGKLSQQLTDMQNLLQSIDAKVSSSQPMPGSQPPDQSAPNGQGSYPQSPATPSGGTGAPSTYNAPYNNAPAAQAPYGAQQTPYGSQGAAPAANSMVPSMPPISADTLYHNALRDYTTGNYDLARQEFADYINHFPSSDLASNSQFYLGEIFYAQKDYRNAIKSYDLVLSNYPQSLKLAASLLKRAEAEDALHERTSGIRDLREVVHKFPGSDESRRARSILQSMGVSATAPRTSH